MQHGGLLSVRNRRLSILNSYPLWGPRRNLWVPFGMLCTSLIRVANLYGSGLQNVFATTPIPSKFGEYRLDLLLEFWLWMRRLEGSWLLGRIPRYLNALFFSDSACDILFFTQPFIYYSQLSRRWLGSATKGFKLSILWYMNSLDKSGKFYIFFILCSQFLFNRGFFIYISLLFIYMYDRIVNLGKK